MSRRNVSLATVLLGCAAAVLGVGLLADVAWALVVGGVCMAAVGLFLVDVQ
jgi:hypothetical protein